MPWLLMFFRAPDSPVLPGALAFILPVVLIDTQENKTLPILLVRFTTGSHQLPLRRTAEAGRCPFSLPKEPDNQCYLPCFMTLHSESPKQSSFSFLLFSNCGKLLVTCGSYLSIIIYMFKVICQVKIGVQRKVCGR